MQVSLECKERAELLSGVWRHCMGLEELRCTLRYEDRINGHQIAAYEAQQEHMNALATVRHDISVWFCVHSLEM